MQKQQQLQKQKLSIARNDGTCVFFLGFYSLNSPSARNGRLCTGHDKWASSFFMGHLHNAGLYPSFRLDLYSDSTLIYHSLVEQGKSSVSSCLLRIIFLTSFYRQPWISQQEDKKVDYFKLIQPVEK